MKADQYGQNNQAPEYFFAHNHNIARSRSGGTRYQRVSDLSEDLTIIALDVNCSDDDLERSIEDVFDELIVDALDTVQDESLEDALVRSNLGCIVKTIDSMLTYKKLEKFIQ